MQETTYGLRHVARRFVSELLAVPGEFQRVRIN